MKKIKKFICKVFGHKFDLIMLTVLKIQDVALNRESFIGESVECGRCGYKLTIK